MKKKVIFLLGILLGTIIFFNLGIFLGIKDIEKKQKAIEDKTIKVIPKEYKSFVWVNKDIKEVIPYEEEVKILTKKLNKSLNSTLENKGEVFARLSLKYKVDPYLAVAIVLHETGCKWTCSYLVRECNNVGGVKGSPSCDGGSYKAYDSLNDGIEAFIKNLKNNYYDKGLDTPEKMEKKYTGGSKTWAKKVRNYMNSIKEK